MLKQDRNTLISFIENYSLKEVIDTLADITKFKTDELVDNLLSDKAKDWAMYHTYLESFSKKIKD